jgi:hypothetical protein
MMGRRVADVGCSFCGKPKEKVRRLVAGPGVYICNECVDLCREVLKDDDRGNAMNGQARGWVKKTGRSQRRGWWARLFRSRELQPDS